MKQCAIVGEDGTSYDHFTADTVEDAITEARTRGFEATGWAVSEDRAQVTIIVEARSKRD